MANYAVIEGEKVLFYNRDLVSEMNLDVFFARTKGSAGFATGRLPNNTKFIANQDGSTAYVVELPPRMVTFRVTEDLYDAITYEDSVVTWATPDDESGWSDEHVTIVPVPWEYYIMTVRDTAITDRWGTNRTQHGSLNLFWSPIQVMNVEQTTLFTANLPNIDAFGRVCLGSATSGQDTPEMLVNDLSLTFYDSVFNTDLGMAPGPAHRFSGWGRLSLDSIPSWQWPDEELATSIKTILATDTFPTLHNTDEAVNSTGSTRYFLDAIATQLEGQSRLRFHAIIDQLIADAAPPLSPA